MDDALGGLTFFCRCLPRFRQSLFLILAFLPFVSLPNKNPFKNPLPGICEYASGGRYEGLWLDGLRHGEGVLSCPPGGGTSLAGLWHRDEFNLVSAAGAFRLSTESSRSSPTVLN